MSYTKKISLIGLACVFLLGLALSSIAAGEKVTINFWTTKQNEAATQAFKEIIAEFEKRNPGITVKYQWFVSWDELMEKTLTAQVAGKGPDVQILSSHNVTRYAHLGVLESLNEYMKNDSTFKTGVRLESMVRRSQIGGKQYALPQKSSTLQPFYNEDLFDQAGIGYPSSTKPMSWEDFRQFGIKITNPGERIYGFKFASYKATWEMLKEFMPFLWCAGGDPFYESEDLSVFKPMFNSEYGRIALKFLMDAIHVDKYALPPGAMETEVIEAGRIGMWVTGPWDVNGLRDRSPDLRFGVTLMPKLVRCKSILSGDYVGIFRTSKHKEEAWKWLSWLINEENDRKYCATTGCPTWKSNFSKSPWSDNPLFAPIALHEIGGEYVTPGETRPAHPKFFESQLTVARELQAAYYGDKTPVEALRDAERKVWEIIKEE